MFFGCLPCCGGKRCPVDVSQTPQVFVDYHVVVSIYDTYFTPGALFQTIDLSVSGEVPLVITAFNPAGSAVYKNATPLPGYTTATNASRNSSLDLELTSDGFYLSVRLVDAFPHPRFDDTFWFGAQQMLTYHPCFLETRGLIRLHRQAFGTFGPIDQASNSDAYSHAGIPWPPQFNLPNAERIMWIAEGGDGTGYDGQSNLIPIIANANWSVTTSSSPFLNIVTTTTFTLHDFFLDGESFFRSAYYRQY